GVAAHRRARAPGVVAVDVRLPPPQRHWHLMGIRGPTIPVLLFVSAALVLWLGAMIHRRARAARATMFVWLLAASAVWCLGSAFEGLSHTVGEKIFWSKIQYVGISGVPPLWFLFLAQYVGSAVGSNRRVRYAMIGMAAVTNAIAFTNDFHGLMWTSVTLSPLDVGIYTHGT